MRIGDLIAERFELEKLAGTGGMGAVYRARDRQTGLPVALKALHDPGGRHSERFLREAQVLATLHHPNIVRYLAHGRTSKGELYMAMEWIDGESLSQRIGRRGLSIPDTIQVVSHLASALAFAHARGIIHRDIKPSNVFVVGGTSVPKLLDFGIARLAQAARLTSNGMMLGTPGYMAPEQARGAASVTARADVFSLGCLLFKCLAARPPFMSEDIRAVMAQVLFEVAPRVASLRKETPPALDELVARMLAKEPSLRPADGAAVLAELRTIAAGVPGAQSSSFDSTEAIGDAELQWICAVLARSPRPTPDSLRQTTRSDEVRATELAVPVAHFPGRGGERARSSSAFEMPQAADEGDVSPEIGTIMDALEGAPADLVDALRPFDAEVDQLADGSLLTTLGDEPDPVALAARAARCAQSLLERRPQLRIVITTGRALRSDHPGVGPALDRAAAMLRQLAPAPPGVRVDETTAQLLRQRFEIDVGVQPPALSGEAAPLPRPSSPLRGRERELARLMDFLQRAIAARGVRWGLLIGAPGVGLTRLAREVRAEAPRQHPGIALWASAADPAEGHTPFAFIRRLLRAGEVSSARLAVFDQHAGASTAPDLVGALASIFEEASRSTPLVLLLDDVDRADPPSLALLARALPANGRLPVAVLGFGRAQIVARLEPLGVAGELRELDPLPDAASAQVVHDLLGEQVAPERLEQLVRWSAGNPWMLRMLIAAPTLAERRFPEPVLARAASRLELLPPEARRALRAVAIFDGDVARGELAAVLGGGSADSGVDAQLDALVRGGWLERRGDGGMWGEATFRVADPIAAEAALAQFTELDRALAHRLAATALEQRGEADLARIGRHWEQAGQRARAADCFRRAASAAMAADQVAAAASYVDRGLDGITDPHLREPLLALAAESRFWQGDLAGSIEAAHALEASGSASSSTLAAALRHHALAAQAGCNLAELRSCAASLLQLPLWADASLMLAAAVTAVGLAELGHPTEAAPLESRLPARPEDAIEPLAMAARLLVDGARAARHGDAAVGHRAFRAAFQTLQSASEPRLAQLCLLQAGSAQLAGHLLTAAETTLRGVRAAAERDGLLVLIPTASLELARVLNERGRHDEAETRLAEAAEHFTIQRRAVGQGLCELARAERLLADDPPRAASAATIALEKLEPVPAAHLRAQLRIAEIHARQGELAPGLALVRTALARLEQLGPEAGEVELLGRRVGAELLIQGGLRDAARDQLTRARSRVSTLAGSLDPTWREALTSAAVVRRLAELAGAWLSNP